MKTGQIRAHPDLAWDVSRLDWPDQQTYSGVEGAMRFLSEWAEAWDDWEIEPENQRGRSNATGVPVDMRFAQVWTFRDGQALRMQMYAHVDEALEAVGLAG